jgi:hypothetical protein
MGQLAPHGRILRIARYALSYAGSCSAATPRSSERRHHPIDPLDLGARTGVDTLVKGSSRLKAASCSSYCTMDDGGFTFCFEPCLYICP